MREVKLIKFESESVMIGDFANRVDCERLDMRMKPKRVNSTSEFLHPQFSVSESVDIEKIVDHGIEHYIAVTRDVWEYMSLIKNPVTVKLLQEEKYSLQDRVHAFNCEVNDLKNILSNQNSELKAIKSAGFLTRIKWLFTGAK